MKTLFGRKVGIDPDRPYAAVNYVVQGTAGDIVKISLLRTYNYLQKNGKVNNEFIFKTNYLDKIDKIGISGLQKEMKLNKFPTSSIKKLISLIELKGNNSSKINYVKTFLSNSKIGLEGISEIENLMKIKNDFTLDFTLARGLSYYTSTIFEVVPKNYDIGSLCGGGRYDDLTEIFGYKNISGIGISFGIERIIEVLNTNNLFPKKIESNNNVLISYLSNDLIKNSLKLANKLREKGLSLIHI